MILLLLLCEMIYADDTPDYSGCACCEVGEGDCSSFTGEFDKLYRCFKRVNQSKLNFNDWFELPLREGYEDKPQTCQTPVGYTTQKPAYEVSSPCDCMEQFSDEIMQTYNCSTIMLKAFDEVCNSLGCKYCNFVHPKCGPYQKKRCDLKYQEEIAINKDPTADDVCRALGAKVNCYKENACDYGKVLPMQQAVKQCRNSSCSLCYETCISAAPSTFILMAVALLVMLF